MAVTLNANSSTGFIATSDTSGVLQLQTGGTTALTVSAAQVVTLANPLPVASGGSGGTTSTGTGANVLGTTPSFTSTIGVGGATASASGAGITFPSTDLHYSTNANTLDDYEEGSFTPEAFGGTSAGTTTYASRLGRYTKIGRQVTVNFNIYYTAMTGTGDLILGNLPFVSSSPTGNYAAGTCMTVGLNWSAGTQLHTFMLDSSSVAKVYCSGDDISGSYQQCVNESAEFYVTLTYFTA